MKYLIGVVLLALILVGCSAIDEGKLVARATANSTTLSQQIDDLQAELSPYIHDQESLKDLDTLQQDMKYMLLGDTRVGTVRELVDRYLVIKEALTNEATERWLELPEAKQTELLKLQSDLALNEEDIMKILNNPTVDKVEVVRYLYEFGKVGLKVYETYKDIQ